jgi:N-acetylglucosaminyldiphosphoundecaprenol N-acetyl-beta-D-mannosaminyltransferase
MQEDVLFFCLNLMQSFEKRSLSYGSIVQVRIGNFKPTGSFMRYKDIAFLKYNGVKVSNINYQNVLGTVTSTTKNNQRGYICLTDVSNLIVATKNEELRTALNESMLSLADGTPLVWYAWMAGCKEIERISGASLMRRLIVDMDGCKHYLLGDTEETIVKVTAEAKRLNSTIEISGHSPPFKEFDEEDNRAMLDKIRKANPDIIWVSFGGVKQEQWMNKNFTSLDRGIMIGVGAAFRFLIGEIITPPPIFQKMGLQWLFRLTESFIKNPIRCVKLVHQRHILTSKFEYMARFPFEVAEARKQIRKYLTM